MRLWAVVNSFGKVVIETGAPFDGEYDDVVVEIAHTFQNDTMSPAECADWLEKQGWEVVPLNDQLAEQYPEII